MISLALSRLVQSVALSLSVDGGAGSSCGCYVLLGRCFGSRSCSRTNDRLAIPVGTTIIVYIALLVSSSVSTTFLAVVPWTSERSLTHDMIEGTLG